MTTNITPTELRLIARSYDAVGQKSLGDKIRGLSSRLELLDTIEDNEIGKFIVELRAATGDNTAGLYVPPAQCQRLADALLMEGADAAERMATAGYEAARAQREAERANELAVANAKALADELTSRKVIHREFCDALMELEEERSKALQIAHENDRLRERIARQEVVNLRLYMELRQARQQRPEIAVDIIFTVAEADVVGAIDPARASDLALALADLDSDVA